MYCRRGSSTVTLIHFERTIAIEFTHISSWQATDRGRIVDDKMSARLSPFIACPIEMHRRHSIDGYFSFHKNSIQAIGVQFTALFVIRLTKCYLCSPTAPVHPQKCMQTSATIYMNDIWMHFAKRSDNDDQYNRLSALNPTH